MRWCKGGAYVVLTLTLMTWWQVGAIHAGLECGIIGEKLPGVDMVSYGPTIKGAHSPDEAVLVSTVQPFWDLTLAILAKLADQR